MDVNQNLTTQTSQVQQSFVDVRNVSKKYGRNIALDNINLTIGAGEIVGLIGPNGAGKSTLLKAIMGLIKYSGELSIFGKDPYNHRAALLKQMSYIADVASLPSWMKVKEVLSFVDEVHPKFSRQRADALLRDTPIKPSQYIAELSKGMKTRLHLAIILSIQTDFLILDEPTLGLDVLVRREFQDNLVQDYYNNQRSILITTHQIDEIESILTRVLFISEGQLTLDLNVGELKTRYSKLTIQQGTDLPSQLNPIYKRVLPDRVELIFEGSNKKDLEQYGEVSSPSLEDLFVATNSSINASANTTEV